MLQKRSFSIQLLFFNNLKNHNAIIPNVSFTRINNAIYNDEYSMNSTVQTKLQILIFQNYTVVYE